MNYALSHSLSSYYGELAKTGPVEPDEETRLVLRWQHHRDHTARDMLIRSNLRFVVKQARKQCRDPERLQDLIAAGNLGLLKALDKYDPNRKPRIRFLTYAGWWVQKEIMDEDYATSSLIHVPTHRQKAQRKQAKAFRKALAAHGPEAASVLLMNPGTPEGTTVSIAALKDAVEEDRKRIQISFETGASDKVLRSAIDDLPLREKTVLNLYYGIKDETRNLVQIAAMLGMSPERVRQIKISGIKLLKEILEEYLVTAPDDAY